MDTKKAVKKSKAHKGVKRTKTYGEKRRKGKSKHREATKFAAGRKDKISATSI